MKRTLNHIACCFALLLFSAVAMAQVERKESVDDILDRYELLCEMCLDLKVRTAVGGNVSKKEAEAFINRFLSCNKDLKARISEMTAAQSRRFSSIGRWFSTGVRPEIVDHPELPVISPLHSKGMIWQETGLAVPSAVCHVQEELSPDPVNSRLYMLASVSAPDMAYGLMAGYVHGRWGGYLSFRSNFVSVKPSYECRSDGTLAAGGSFWAGGSALRNNLSICGGCICGLNERFSVYAGAGYGWRKVAWEDIDGAWAEVSDISHEGLVIDAGLIFTIHRLALSAGISSIAFKTAAFNVGLGIVF